MRWLYLLNVIFFFSVITVAYGGVSQLWRLAIPDAEVSQVRRGIMPGKGTWYEKIKPYCNAVEVEMAMRTIAPPSDNTSQAYAAACYALAGKINKSRSVLNSLPKKNQSRAANIVFNVAHPIADAGDDKSAGPIMQLVVGYSPDHYMALYHAGISLHATGHMADAQKHLLHFLELYKNNDGWRRRATQVLERIQRNQ